MTREELEQAIENGESVWGISKLIQHIYIDSGDVVEIQVKDFDYLIEQNILILYTKSGLSQHIHLDYLFKTKAAAEHYLHHANVTRTETLPFLTWKEFTSDIMAFNSFGFITEDGFRAGLMCDKATNLIILDSGKEIRTWDLTEANFYKAYDECVRLFAV